MAILSFVNESAYNREASSISLDVPDDMNIFEFKTMCVRLAAASGYTDTSIKKAFGEDDYITQSDKDFMKFIQSLTNPTGSVENINLIWKK